MRHNCPFCRGVIYWEHEDQIDYEASPPAHYHTICWWAWTLTEQIKEFASRHDHSHVGYLYIASLLRWFNSFAHLVKGINFARRQDPNGR